MAVILDFKLFQNNLKTYCPVTHFSAQTVSSKKNKKKGTLKGLYHSSENKSTSLLFRLSKYHLVDRHSLHKQGSDYKLWE